MDSRCLAPGYGWDYRTLSRRYVGSKNEDTWCKILGVGPQIRYSPESTRRTHEDKISICTLNSGNDFLGWVHFFDHRVLRAATKRRMLKRLATDPTPETINSYLGLMSHGNTEKLKKSVLSGIISESRLTAQ